jgi:hypothetical protein
VSWRWARAFGKAACAVLMLAACAQACARGDAGADARASAVEVRVDGVAVSRESIMYMSVALSFSNHADRPVRVTSYTLRWPDGARTFTADDLTLAPGATVQRGVRVYPGDGDLDTLETENARVTVGAPAAQTPAAKAPPAPAAPAVVEPPPEDPWDAVLSQMPTRDCTEDGWCVVYELPKPRRWLDGAIWTQDYQVFIGSYGAVAHYDGKGWALQQTPAKTRLWEIRGSAADDMYAVGTMWAVVHWDGQTWTAEVRPKGNPRGYECLGIRVAGPGDVYVTCNDHGDKQILHRLDGKWSQVDAVPESVPVSPAGPSAPDPGLKKLQEFKRDSPPDVARLGNYLLAVTRFRVLLKSPRPAQP